MKKLLIADDDETSREVLSLFFEKEPFEIYTVNDGQECLDALALHDPDLFLLDILMPRVDGLEVLKFLKEHNSYKHKPVIMMSNFVTQEIQEIINNAHKSEFYIKVNTEPATFVKRARFLLNL